MSQNDMAGLDMSKANKTVNGLKTVLSDMFVTYVKVLNFHWNIKGRRFAPLHEFLEEQYKFLAETADAVAERIKVFDTKAPGSMGEFLKYSTIKESTKDTMTADEMLAEVNHDYGKLITLLRSEHDNTADNDFGTQTLYEDLITEFEKTRWMIKSHLT